jgi:hypothetical protein
MTPPKSSATATAAKAKSGPNGAGPGSSPVAEMVTELRKLAETSPGRAQRETWEWFKELGAAKANDDLAELFGLGTAPQGLAGPTEGILVNPIIQPAFDAFARLVTSGWMPWMGKSFYPERQRGSNRITGSGRIVSKLLWPTYQMTPSPEGNMAFDFDTRVEPGAIEPAPDVLVIDYADEERNPELIIRKIRDELVEIVPDTYLGRILYRLKDGSYNNIGYFALKQRPSS